MPATTDLGAFIRARRDRRQPQDADPRRRVPGLRREELAASAGLSADYLRRVEQGSVVPSDSLLDALADALELDGTERAHLDTLADRARGRQPLPSAPAEPSASLVRTLEALAPTPAVVLGRCCEVVAWNATGAALDPAVAALPAGERNVARRVLLDPSARELYPEWEALAREVADVLRLNAARFPGDAGLRELIDQLRAGSDAFRRDWSRQDVFEKTAGRKVIDHPEVGRLELDYETFDVTRAPGQVLIVYTAAPGTPTAARLRLLAGASVDAESSLQRSSSAS
jgi:transcriptional regulator with XRE-family HTH domain